MPALLLLAALLLAMATIHSTYEIWKRAEIYFMNSASYSSLAILTILNFQFFGVFMVLGLSYAPQYFQYLTVAGVCCFLASITINKLAYLFFMTQNSSHPLINQNGFRSPRVRFHCLVIVFQLVFYIAGFVMVRLPAFSWYVSALYIFPLVHIGKEIYKGNRNNFRL